MNKGLQKIVDTWYSEYIKENGVAPTWGELLKFTSEVEKER